MRFVKITNVETNLQLFMEAVPLDKRTHDVNETSCVPLDKRTHDVNETSFSGCT